MKVKLFATSIMVILYNLRFYVHDLNGSVMARARWEHKTRAVVFACGVFAEKSKWDSDQQKAKKGTVHSVNGHSCSARDINSAISEMNEVISEAFNEFGRAGTSPTPMELKDKVKAKLEELHPKVKVEEEAKSLKEGLVHTKSIDSIFDEFISAKWDEMKWRSEYTMHHYNEIRNNVKSCMSESGRFKGMTVADINTSFLNELKRWYVKNEYYNKTTNKHFSNLKTVLRWAKSKGYPVRDEVIFYKTELDDPQKVVVFIYDDELTKLLNFPFKEGSHLDSVRDLFCFMVLTSLRISDLRNLKKTDVLGETIRIYTQKTHKPVIIPITERARKIIDKYKDSIPGERLFHVFSDQKMNDGIKEAAKKAGLSRLITEVHGEGTVIKQETHPLFETLSCHDARRTFVCLSLRLGIPAEVIMKSTGHTNYQALKPYMDVMEETVTEQMKKWDSKPQKGKNTIEELKAQLAILQRQIESMEKGDD
ncbi:MAG: tyrosine-type recombinase/integrase [Bacteroidales bacterium]|nr:tyrosine-type recombinase/integrase [Bacteroidales bacterium]